MRVALLTTDGLPARRCAQALSEAYELAVVVVRTTPPDLPFETAHPFDADQDAFEAETWFRGSPPNLEDFASVAPVADMAADNALDALKTCGAEVAVALNCGPIGAPVREFIGPRTVVLHGANPQDYRGDDIHLWVAYHGDESRQECVVQQPAAEVNAGPVLFAARPAITPDMTLRELRRSTTDICITGAMKALHYFANGGMLSVNSLHRVGKLYTPMPAALKDYCVARFNHRAEGAN